MKTEEGKSKKVKGKSQGKPHLIKRLVSASLFPFTFLLFTSLALASDPFETGSASKVRVRASSPEEIKIISYNIRWRSGEELRRIIRLLDTDTALGQAAIIGLQEVDRNKRRTGNANTVRLMAEELGMYYAWAAPPVKEGKEEETGVAILSAYPLTDVRRIVLPVEGPGGRRRVALGATALIGGKPLRFYSVHAETRISTKRKTEQLRAVLDDLSQFPNIERAIVLGDFNTWQGDALSETSKLFQDARFETPFPNDQSTFATRTIVGIFDFKLDWIWLRNLKATTFGIERKIEISDHYPLWLNVKLSVVSGP
ncbi:MAG: endonuclease/exonuclease/phosphatase family protein [Pyrinomonadaceae bacterium]